MAKTAATANPLCATLPHLGFGVGLRGPHYAHILEQWPAVDWFEALTESYLGVGGRRRYVLSQVAERYPVVLHGVSLGIGATDPIDRDYLAQVKALAKETRAAWISDHVCWTGIGGKTTHDLLPIAYNPQTLAHLVARIAMVQDILERPLVLENPSTYFQLADSTLSEQDFLAALVAESGCGLLIDINNIYVSCTNHGWSPAAYLAALPWDSVVQLHLAGHSHRETYLLDTHDGPVSDPVWALYGDAVSRGGPRSTLIEWDARIPAFETVHAEAERARSLCAAMAPGVVRQA